MVAYLEAAIIKSQKPFNSRKTKVKENKNIFEIIVVFKIKLQIFISHYIWDIWHSDSFSPSPGTVITE